MKKLNVEYLKGLLQKRKDLLRREMKAMILDKKTTLDTIKAREAEMAVIDEVKNELETI